MIMGGLDMKCGGRSGVAGEAIGMGKGANVRSKVIIIIEMIAASISVK